MNLLLVIALISLTLQFATTAAVLTLGATPRWRRTRWFAAVSFTAGCYSLVDVVAAAFNNSEGSSAWATRLNLFNGTLHAVAWLLFTYMGDDGQWSSLPRWVQRWAIGGAGVVAMLAVTGFLVVDSQLVVLEVPALGIAYHHAELTNFGMLVAVVPLTFLCLSAAGYVRRWRAGEPGAGAILVGFALFLAALLEEVAVAAGWLDFVFLADVGYVCVVMPVSVQMMRRFRDDAFQLDLLSTELAQEVDRRTEERDAARRGMLEQQRLAALGRLAAGVGHEINNPLQYLRFNLEELQEHLAAHPSEQASTAVTQAFEGVERIRHVVDGLRTYGRPADAEPTLLDMREVVRAALRVGAPQWRQGVQIDAQFGDIPLVEGNEGRLVQVILNPLVNAAQSMLQAVASDTVHANAARSLVVITRTTTAGEAQVDILDDGPGFSDTVLGRLGEPYVTTRAAQGGTGLGLFVTRGLVESHGGTITFSNRAGGGALVRITLPAARGQARAGTPAATMPSVRYSPEASAPRVLLVEDDPAALRALIRGLEAEGIRAFGALGGTEALEWLSREPVDLVITDLIMPGVSGPEFARRLGVAHPQLRERLVVLTGGASTAEAEAFLHDPGLLVLDKPILRQELARQIRGRLREA